MTELEELKTIERMVSKYLFSTVYDVEDIAVKIWIELKEKERYLSYLYVKNRCIDEIRKHRKISFCPIEEFENLESSEKDYTNAKEIIDILMDSSALTHEERMAIYVFYYKGETVPTFILDKAIAKLKKQLTILKNAKKEL